MDYLFTEIHRLLTPANPTLTSGITYYYVISAVNAYGESANSTQASAKAN